MCRDVQETARDSERERERERENVKYEEELEEELEKESLYTKSPETWVCHASRSIVRVSWQTNGWVN